MKKEEIITLANSMGFLLDYDRFDDKDYPGVANPDLRFMRFISYCSSNNLINFRHIPMHFHNMNLSSIFQIKTFRTSCCN